MAVFRAVELTRSPLPQQALRSFDAGTATRSEPSERGR